MSELKTICRSAECFAKLDLTVGSSTYDDDLTDDVMELGFGLAGGNLCK